MQPYQERVFKERDELAVRTGKLGEFLFGDVFSSLPKEEQLRLVKQHAYMKVYLEVLDERIAALGRWFKSNLRYQKSH